jgi:hypothetical protein
LIIGSGELVNRLPEVIATETLLVDVFDLENSPLAKSQFISNFFACTGPLMDQYTMQANEELLIFLESSKIALSHAATHLNIKTPTFEVANTIQELEILLANWPTGAIVKADYSGGGAR